MRGPARYRVVRRLSVDSLPPYPRVRREDLAESQDSPWTIGGGEGVGVDADLQARLDAQIAETLGINVHDRQQQRQQQQPTQGPLRPSAHDDEAGWDDASDAGEFEFRLFKSTTAPTKVVLESNDAAAQGQGALVQRRPASFYLADNITDTLKQEYDFAAVTGEDVVLRSQRPSWGMEFPWRVTAVTMTRSRAEPGQLGVVMVGSQDEEKMRGRKRPGKKKRIAVRKRLRAKMDKNEAVAKKAQEKEEHLQEKRKRLNRLKKLRRRAKDKEKRALGSTDNAEEGSD